MDNVVQTEQPKRFVAVFFALAAIVVGFFLEHVLMGVFAWARVNDSTLFAGYTVSSVIGFGTAIVLAVALWRLPRTHTLSMQVAEELRRVTWPSFRETRAATLAVIAASAIAAAVLGVFDFVWSWLSQQVY
jgi:preprotein translocase subunit SecE